MSSHKKGLYQISFSSRGTEQSREMAEAQSCLKGSRGASHKHSTHCPHASNTSSCDNSNRTSTVVQPYSSEQEHLW